jgi:ADP-heptose:LPS heptosyltransferase
MSDDILIIRHGALGDFIQSLGPIHAIRQRHPSDRITLLTTPPFAALAEACPDIDRVWLDDRPGILQISSWRQLRQRLRAGNFAWVYDLQTSDRSSFYYRFFADPKPNWSGIASGASHPHDNPGRNFLHTVDRQREQLAAAGIDDVPPTNLDWLDADIGRFGLPGRYALLIPGGSAHRHEKRWPISGYAELAARLATEGILPVILGGPDEAALAAGFSGEVTDLTGQTSFADIAGLARGAVCAVGNDTGPSHIIAAAGCPILVLFSDASDPALCAPRGARVDILRHPSLADLDAGRVWQAVQTLVN